jgi:hypothetical protein
VTAVVLVLAAMSIATTPSIRLEAREPVVVRGVSFAAHERVTLTIAVGDRRAKVQALADVRGGFRARSRLHAGRCGELVVRARGSNGSRASLVLRRPDCLPQD